MKIRNQKVKISSEKYNFGAYKVHKEFYEEVFGCEVIGQNSMFKVIFVQLKES